jgi:hypothetical protein
MINMKVKLIIANTQSETVYFNYGDDCSDVTRVLVEDHSPWEEVDDLHELELFVRDFNNIKNKPNFAFLIVCDEQISAQSAIKVIRKKREDYIRKQKEAEEKRKELIEKKKQEAKLKKLAKTKEEKRKLFEKLKQEFAEN